MTTNPVNSSAYWDARFDQDWESAGGREETRFFCDLALRYLPKWVAKDIRSHALSICDWGCALGDALEALAASFPESKLTGVDIAPTAIERARERYPDFSFHTLDDLPEDASFDVVVCSNTLEHHDRPLELLQQMLERARRYALVLVPFREAPRIDEHLSTFDYNSFPLRIGAFHLLHFRSIPCASIPKSCWSGEQLLVVFGHADHVDLREYRLQSLIQGMADAEADLRERLGRLERQLAQLPEVRKALQESIEQQQQLERALESMRQQLADARASKAWRLANSCHALANRSGLPAVASELRSRLKRR
ncbi:MAG: methyltransferase [Myxococcales bacterium]|jgi:SAM-dependent methyltransferase